MTKADPDRVFEIDEGFGNARLVVSAVDCKESGGGGFVHLFASDRDATISIDFDLWDRITKAVERARDQ